MKKVFIWIVCWVCITEIASASVVISQVLYNPLNSESGGEAVEIHNNGNEDIAISGWVLATESTMNDAVIPENTIICPGCYYLIADSGWNESKDSQSWPDADLEEPITMSNTDSGVALTKNGSIVDAVGWGNPDEINDGLFEGTPANNAEEGKSLLREGDTNNNIDDFIEAEPFFRSSSDLGTGKDSEEIGISFEVLNATAQIPATIDLVNISEGRIINPVPGGAAEITVNAQITGQDINKVTATLAGETAVLSKAKEVNATTSVFSGALSLEHYMPPGEYSIEINADGEKAEISFEYEELVAIQIDKETLDFGKIEAGKDYVSEVRIRNIGNKVVDIGLKGDFDCNCLYYSFGSDFSMLTSNTIIKNTNLDYGNYSETALKLKLSASGGITSGEHEGIVEITAVGSEN
ncbi:lamin tail domain-containing protein [Candidatus Woesearchaeota archaeon]|nr:lamin tail domain-containing protein [Candidatus Woesearchaeota archaeon]